MGWDSPAADWASARNFATKFLSFEYSTEIFQIVTEYKEDLKTAGEQLVSRANENGGKDNISIILIAYGDILIEPHLSE